MGWQQPIFFFEKELITILNKYSKRESLWAQAKELIPVVIL
jgi:hypothetical protein